jgi:hypothetical protein
MQRLGGDIQFAEPFEKSFGASALQMPAETPLRGSEAEQEELSLTLLLGDY